MYLLHYPPLSVLSTCSGEGEGTATNRRIHKKHDKKYVHPLGKHHCESESESEGVFVRAAAARRQSPALGGSVRRGIHVHAMQGCTRESEYHE